ncbi:MAG: flagellar basal body-associated FliL family protein [Roseburia sp.]|nr:flagellar basal body-associated FliL family protein [Ruminococcus sp.]MCM1156185.1 flagellar basal body-associated FliL family protein [Roseburia sp.]MCM1241737.1 flagellar basal body-associated FliL family protein [Roseburia sp.]
MKKNLISIIILALLVVNVVLTAVMMFSVTSASKKTAALVDNISTALNLELTAQTGDAANAVNVPMEETEVYTIADSMTISLKADENGEAHFCIVSSVGFSINIKDKAYKTYGSDLSAQETLIKDIINSVFGRYTMEEARANEAEIKQEILKEVQDLFDSEFIYNVAFSGTMYQ